MNNIEVIRFLDICDYHCLNHDIEITPKVLDDAKRAGIILPNVSDKLTPEIREQLAPYITYKIEGIREETYMGQVCDGDYNYHKEELTKHIVCCSKGDEKYEIELYTSYGMCPSGYTTASWGNMIMRRVEEFGKITHIPKEPLAFELEMNYFGFECPAFKVDFEGGDEWYPSGYTRANMELFMEKTHKVEQSTTKTSLQGEMEAPAIDDMSIPELLAMEAQIDEKIKETDAEIEAEIERQKVLERLENKLLIAKQKKKERDALLKGQEIQEPTIQQDKDEEEL